MKKFRFITLIMISAFLVVTSCEKDAAVKESEVLAEYLESTDSPLMKDYVNTELPSIIGATEVKTLNEAGQAYVIDIRPADVFASGHIPGAYNVALADLLTHVQTADFTGIAKIVVTCYTGQSAGYGVTLLRLMGYDNVYSLKWGMCSWHDDFAGKWYTAISTGNAFATQFTSVVTEKGAEVNMPELTTGMETGQEILEVRVDDLLVDGYSVAAVSSQTVFDNLDDYYIVNYWPADRYADPGHIPGAIQYTPKADMKSDTYLKTLPTDKPIVVYCYTGQASSFLTAYLRLLGYDAKSLLYGANSMIYDIMKDLGWTTFS
ncbi:rhodanese-like domain-containing protein, partial [Bacteroidota bacterium]